jgi:predicted transcriptional regulator
MAKGDALNLIVRQQAEIEKLKADIRTVDQDLYELDRPLTEIKTEAIKEVFDKIKAVNRWSCVDIRYFDKVYKEMVGEQG